MAMQTFVFIIVPQSPPVKGENAPTIGKNVDVPNQTTPAKRRATLRDVAQLAGVDLSTASRLLRNEVEGYRAETRDRVQQAAVQLGYRTNAQARALRLGRQETIAMLVPDLDNFGFTQVLRGVQDACEAHGFTLLISEVRSRTQAGENGLSALEGKVDGVLVAFATADDAGVRSWLANLDLPAVLVQRGVPGAEASVLLDEERNAATVVDYLVGLGHRDIAHVSGSLRTDTGLRRYRGFEDAIARHDLMMRPQWRADGDFSFEGGRLATLKIMSLPPNRRPTAIAVDSLVEAIGALSALRELGISIPAEVSVMAIDEHFIAGQLTPPLTTLRLPQRALGGRAAEMLFDVILGQPGSRVIISDPVEIIERKSTAPPPE